MAAGAYHANAMASIHEAAFPPAERWQAAALADLLALPGVYGLIAPAGGFVLGRMAADEAEILTLAVTPDAQNQGLGRRLLEAAADVAACRGATSMFLEVSDRNVRAMALYDAAGFAACGRRRRYYSDGADALLLRRGLTSASAAPA